MDNKIEIFKNEQFGEVRTILEGEKVLFCAADVAKALGYTNPNKAVNDHCRAITKRSTPISGKVQSINFIPEGERNRYFSLRRNWTNLRSGIFSSFAVVRILVQSSGLMKAS